MVEGLLGLTFFQREPAKMPLRPASPIATAPDLAEGSAPPATLGLGFFGLTFLLFNFYSIGIFPLSAPVLALGIFYGAAGQVVVGVYEWRRNRIFAATAFTAYGLFWLSLIALTILPRAGFGQLPDPSAMTAYLGVWCLFTLILCIAALQLNRILQLVFATFFLYLLLRTAGASLGPVYEMLAGSVGILGGAGALCSGILQGVKRRTADF